MNLTRRHFLELAATCALSVPCTSCSFGSGPAAQNALPSSIQRTFFAFDTACVIGGSMEQGILDDAVEFCTAFEQRLSRTIPDSDVSRINRSQGAPVEVDRSTAELLVASLRYCEESGGLFDVTIGAVSSLWDFSRGIVPSAEEISKAVEHVDYRLVDIDETRVRLLDPEAKLDLGGIAKGYIADETASFLADHAVESAFINLGGNVKVLGNKEDGSPWSIGVRDPKSDNEADVVARVSSTGGSLVTSGLYERRFEYDGREYWHILDPRTGYPVESDAVSASVYSNHSIDGDGFTKPLFMLSPDDALDFIESHEGLQGLIVMSDGALRQTSGNVFERMDPA